MKYEERVGGEGRRRHVVFPLSSGRAVPSKWDDAERWICSPVLGMAVDSPFFGQPNSSSSSSCYGGRRSCPVQSEQESACTREWLHLLNQTPHPQFQSQFQGPIENQVSRVFSTRDMGTQMLPSDSQSQGSSTYEIQMDEILNQDTSPINLKHTTIPNISPPSHESDTESHLPISKLELEREDPNINELENLQREKAEAAMRKLKMELEKKRSKAMEKIMKKLKRAELKAEKMRASLSETESNTSKHTTIPTMAGFYRRIQLTCIANCLGCGCD